MNFKQFTIILLQKRRRAIKKERFCSGKRIGVKTVFFTLQKKPSEADFVG